MDGQREMQVYRQAIWMRVCSSLCPAHTVRKGRCKLKKNLLWGIVDEQSVEVNAVWQNVAPDVVATNTQGIKCDRIPAFDGHFNSF